MIRRRFWLLAFVFAPVAALAPATPVAAKTPCDLAAATAEAGQLDVATQLYEELLQQKPKQSCAVTGYADVAGRRRQATSLIDQAATASKLDQKDVAIADLARALSVDPSSTAARALLRDISGAPADLYAGAHALLKAGYRAEARDEAKRVAKTAPPDKPVPADLKEPSSWWSRTKALADDFVGDVGSYGAALGILAGFAAVVGVPAFYLFVLKRKWSRRVSVEKLNVPADVAPNADSLTAMLIDEIGNGGSGRSLDLVKDDPGAPQFDVAAALGDKWKWLGALWKSLPLNRSLTVSGEAFMAGDGEARMILRIAKRRTRVVATRMCSFRDPELKQADLLDLALRDAAAWLAWTLWHEGAAKSIRGDMLDWQSWGRFRQGVWFTDHGQDDKARTRYVDAVGFDRNNAAAWLNLASLDIWEDYDSALERLELADACLKAQLDGRSELSSAVWYRVKHLTCVALLNKMSQAGSSPATRERRQRARHAALDLVHGLAQVRLALMGDQPLGDDSPFKPLRTAEREDLAALGRNTEDSAIALFALSLVTKRHLPPEEPYDGQSDAAACWKTLSELELQTATVKQVLECLFAIHRGAGMHWLAEYNLACMYARACELASDPVARAAYRKLSFDRLPHGLEGRGAPFLSYARDEDPTLEALREPGKVVEKFHEIVEASRPKPAPAKPKLPPDVWKLTVP